MKDKILLVLPFVVSAGVFGGLLAGIGTAQALPPPLDKLAGAQVDCSKLPVVGATIAAPTQGVTDPVCK